MYITPLRHERMRKWLNLDSTRGAALRGGRIGGLCQRRDYLEKCKVEFNQLSCWLYFVLNLLVF